MWIKPSEIGNDCDEDEDEDNNEWLKYISQQMLYQNCGQKGFLVEFSKMNPSS